MLSLLTVSGRSVDLSVARSALCPENMKASSSSLTGMLVRMWEEETAESREAVRLKYHIRGIGDDDQPQSHSPRSSDQHDGGGREQNTGPRRGRGHHHHHQHQARQLPRPEVIYEADEEFDDEGGIQHQQRQVAVVVLSSV